METEEEYISMIDAITQIMVANVIAEIIEKDTGIPNPFLEIKKLREYWSERKWALGNVKSVGFQKQTWDTNIVQSVVLN